MIEQAESDPDLRIPMERVYDDMRDSPKKSPKKNLINPTNQSKVKCVLQGNHDFKRCDINKPVLLNQSIPHQRKLIFVHKN